MMIPEDTIQAVKTAADIVDVVSEKVVLKKAGRNYVGLCPFHSEKTPSFTVSPEKQIFYCFGCHTGGSAISFLMKSDGLSFPDAVRYLGRKYGVSVPEYMDSRTRRRLTENEKLQNVNKTAMEYYCDCLESNQGRKAMAYLVARGFTGKLINSHSLGYAPDRWDGLSSHLRAKGVAVKLMEKAGLVIRRKSGDGVYDRFRDRVIFPIFDGIGRVVGFGGRTIDSKTPKYLNSPETPIFNKRKILYGIDRVRQLARATGTIFIVEGYFDMLALHQVGIQNTVATLGTALTADHVRVLKGIVGSEGSIVLVFDSDQAGIKAARRSLDVFADQYVDARILVLPEGHDPDSYLRQFGPDDFMLLASKAKASVEFIIDAAISEFGLSVEGKVKTVDQVKTTLAVIDDPVKKDLYIRELADKLGIDRQAVIEKVKSAASRHGERKLPGAGGKGGLSGEDIDRPGNLMQRQVIAMLLKYPDLVTEFVGRNLETGIDDRRLKKISDFIISRAQPDSSLEAQLVDAFQGTDMEDVVAAMLMDTERWNRRDCMRLLDQFESHCHRKYKIKLQKQIEAAERDKDMKRLLELLKEKQLFNERRHTNPESLGG